MVETVNVFGTKMNESKVSVFYHGVSLMYFDSFRAAFNGPTSTTTALAVAAIFAADNGIILELAHKDRWSEDVRYFNCSFVSAFGNEQERIFIRPYDEYECLHLVSIRNMATNENYKQYINALNLFQRTIVRGFYENDIDGKLSERTKILNEMISVMTGKNTEHALPRYIQQCWKKWTHSVKEVDFRLNEHKNMRSVDCFDATSKFGENFNIL